MGIIPKPTSAQLQAQHIHRIYGLIDSPDGWLQMIEALHALANQEQSRDALQSLLPHIEQANLLMTNMTALQLSHEQNQQVMNRLPMAVMFITPDGKIISNNHRAQELIVQRIHFIDHEARVRQRRGSRGEGQEARVKRRGSGMSY